MPRGNFAKDEVAKRIKEAFGSDWVGVYDKKIVVWADDGGERVQIALSMTCPKVPVGVVNTAELNYNTGRDFDNDDFVVVRSDTVEISDAERENVRRIMERLKL